MGLLFWFCAYSTAGCLIYWAFFHQDEEIRHITRMCVLATLFMLALCYVANQLFEKYGVN